MYPMDRTQSDRNSLELARDTSHVSNQSVSTEDRFTWKSYREFDGKNHKIICYVQK